MAKYTVSINSLPETLRHLPYREFKITYKNFLSEKYASPTDYIAKASIRLLHLHVTKKSLVVFLVLFFLNTIMSGCCSTQDHWSLHSCLLLISLFCDILCLFFLCRSL